ncbi:MarR family transcriptional regulator [Rhodocytophaga aerolata]|uniref:MarR family transcriptional regulator n=1 Tax=Rhodocytophaga aerolata TaxID=455078 RepID=A0ABT8REV7_9BACT|nr:MarR family transcriptional regulator [Rhodocytophaga aerolata]MDO1450600.1 MarR family transcriptional regulator [Rhodocytophaga aerolata]
MKLEKEIQQSKFQNEFQKLYLNIIYTASWLNLKNTQRLKPFGVSPQQYNILRILRGQYPNSATVTLLTERMLDKNSNASRLVEKLKQKQLVDRCECPEDRRAVNVKITQKGLDLLAKLDVTDEHIQRDLNQITGEEAALVNAVLDKLRG